MSQPCHISSSRSCPAPSWAPPAPSSGLQDSSSCGQRLNNQLSVDSGGSLTLQPRPVPPPAYSEAPQHRGGGGGGLSAPSFTTLSSLTSHNNNHASHS